MYKHCSAIHDSSMSSSKDTSSISGKTVSLSSFMFSDLNALCKMQTSFQTFFQNNRIPKLAFVGSILIRST